MPNEKVQLAKECARKAREYLINKYGGSDALEGKCKEAADLMIKALKSRGITASKHFGWCIYDSCENVTGEPCAPHCYVLVHDGTKRYYLDSTATQFKQYLDREVAEVIILNSGDRPYWFREKKPTLKDMERTSDYY